MPNDRLTHAVSALLFLVAFSISAISSSESRKFAGSDNPIYLPGMPRTGDRSGYRRQSKCPSDRDSTGRQSVPLSDLGKKFSQGKISRQKRLLILGISRAPIIGGNAAIRSRVILPESSPDCIGE
jgi:hypothetical protein